MIEAGKQRGHVEIIEVRPRHLAPTVEAEAWDLGPDADHRRLNKRKETWLSVDSISSSPEAQIWKSAIPGSC